MTNETQAASQEPAAPDLDSILDSAIETHAPKAEAPVAEAASGDAAPTAPTVEPKANHPSDPARYADGTFKPTKTDSAAPVASEQEPTADAATTAPATTPEPAPQPLEAPARWTAEQKAKFAAWPRDVQEAVIERNREIEADYTRKTQEAAELRRSAEPILNAIKPYEPYLNQLAPRIGTTPDQMLANLVGVEYQLRTGDPQMKVQALYQIAAEYGIDLAAISRGELPAAPDPAYTQLRQSFGSLQQEVASLKQQRELEEQQRTFQAIQTFASATDEAGRPKYPHFERVRGVMGQLMRSDDTLTLETAYQKAIEPIQQAIADGLKSQQEAAERERQAAVERAKKAAPVKGSGSQPNGSAKSKDLDSMLWENINSRMA